MPLPPPPRSRTVCTGLRDARARALVAPRAQILRLKDHAARLVPLASRPLLSSTCFCCDTAIFLQLGRLAVRVELAARCRAAREDAHDCCVPLRAPALRL
eukprot:7004295-Prymnesium_polylepis.1